MIGTAKAGGCPNPKWSEVLLLMLSLIQHVLLASADIPVASVDMLVHAKKMQACC